ncbi:MAG: NAD(+) synthase [Bacteroidales bacterium]|nr:NAD(+) synthase [Bacteroidales bacterium]
MQQFGFIKVAAAVPVVEPANCNENTQHIIQLIQEAQTTNNQIVCFPELTITGYTCADLFHNNLLLENAEKALQTIIDASRNLPILICVGLPLRVDNNLYNCAALILEGTILALIPKTFRPNYNEFYEQRWFASAFHANRNEVELCGQCVPFGTDIIVNFNGTNIAVELCEDLWTPIPPSSLHCLAGAELILNLSASNAIIGKNDYRKQLIAQQTARCNAAMVYASAGFGESSTDLLFAGSAIIAENGTILAESQRFTLQQQLITTEIDIERLRHDRCKNQAFMEGLKPLNTNTSYRIVDAKTNTSHFELSRHIDPTPFVPTGKTLESRCEEIINIQSTALAVRLTHTHIKNVVVGISGGLDSTLALLVCVKAFDKLNYSRKGIIGITMPGFGTTNRTKSNAEVLMDELGVTSYCISIADACRQHFKDIEHDPSVTDVTYENTQARERTQILMDMSNKHNALVIGTGDMSELALGWATYNGDHMSMYAVNTGVPKTLVRHLVQWYADYIAEPKAREVLLDIIDTPISPELLPADDKDNITQKTEDLVGPYELHDFFLYYMLRWGFTPKKIKMLALKAFENKYDETTITHWLKTFMRRFFNQQFKRSCMPDGPKVGSINLSPRGDWRMPSDASSKEWQENI